MTIPHNATIVGANDTLKKIWKRHFDPTFSSFFACAFIAGALAAWVTNPLDVIKTRMQTQFLIKESFFQEAHHEEMISEKEGRLKQLKYSSIIESIFCIFKEEGIRGFYKGVIPRIASVAPSAAVSWSTYELFKRNLKMLRF